jgi:hypothetical protein
MYANTVSLFCIMNTTKALAELASPQPIHLRTRDTGYHTEEKKSK